ncbi:NAD(P)-dependent alcohol dehydrogenase [Haladaptatus sp. DJG-WS-42]|uniref:NAD(P)-dependent alcohol dehydrogenase n=1 Tax=Haladaptatus sp. DJG-WS-42 TaxID=3120516 RepID=UPI0030CB3CA0
MRTVNAAVVTEPSGDFHIEELTLSEPRADEVLVRIVATGICPADAAVRKQHFSTPLPAVLGHEGAGVVEAVGENVTTVAPGDHVVLSFDHDRTCRNCRDGNPAYCSNLSAYNFAGVRGDTGTSPLQRDGDPVSLFFGQSSFATHSVVSARQVVAVPTDVPLELLGPLGCSVQTGSGAVLNSLDPAPGTSIAVFGVGAVGLSAVLGAVVAGCTKIIAVDRLQSRLEMAENFGATHTIHVAETTDFVETIRELTGDGVDFSLDTTSAPERIRQAVRATRETGTCGLLGGAPEEPEPTFELLPVLRGRRVRGISQGDSIPAVFIPRLIELYQQDRFPFDEFVTFYDFSDINRAFEDVADGRVIKPVLRIGDV